MTNDPHEPALPQSIMISSIPVDLLISNAYVEAIDIVKDEEDGISSAWLKLAYSLERTAQPRSNHTCLIRDQVRAVAALRHCTGSDINV